MASDNNYEVGFKKPPKATQFQPGKSGNPAGRPKGKKNVSFLELFMQRATKKLPSVGGQPPMNIQEYMIQCLFKDSVKDRRAREFCIGLFRENDARLAEAQSGRPDQDDAAALASFKEMMTRDMEARMVEALDREKDRAGEATEISDTRGEMTC